MKLLIFAGGYGSRLAEFTSNTPKPLVQIGGKPIIWHIMKYYSTFGVNEFVLLVGYKALEFVDYFKTFNSDNFDIEIQTNSQEMIVHRKNIDNWSIRIIDTGLDTMTGSRLYRAKHSVENDDNFFLTYGDGLSNIDLSKLSNHHHSSDNCVTLSAVSPPGRFGVIEMDYENNKVTNLIEKPNGDGALINGGFFVVSSEIFNEHFEEVSTVWETDILESLSAKNKLGLFKHTDFWQSMDTLREKQKLEYLWKQKECPWRIW